VHLRSFSFSSEFHFHFIPLFTQADSYFHFGASLLIDLPQVVLELKKNADFTISFWSYAELQSRRNSSPYAKLK
jgi:hypothetical protein